jgi:hypothetical protein
MMDGLKMKYFILNPSKDDSYGNASRMAMHAYADAIEAANPQLAKELREWAQREYDRLLNIDSPL